MAITLEERPIRTCHFGVFHISLGSTLCTESELKSDVALGNVPSSDIKLIGSFDLFFIIVFSKYHEYRQPSIFCHARLKFILQCNGPSEIGRDGVK
jgi:hypothetical protein